jgi:HK97 family phage prohead protease
MITKNLDIKEYKEVDDEVIRIMASDESVDRDNDIIKVDGWNVENWLKTGSLIYGHDPSSPFNVIGSAEKAEVQDGKLYLYSRLAKKGTSPTHDAVRSLIDQKILRGVSVGFKSTDWEANEYGGRTFLKQELLEISLTPIPANQNAHVVKNFDTKVCEDLGVKVEDNECEDYKSARENFMELADLYEELKEENELQRDVIDKLTKDLNDERSKYKSLLKQILEKDDKQEETKEVEPERTLSEKELKFLNLLKK